MEKNSVKFISVFILLIPLLFLILTWHEFKKKTTTTKLTKIVSWTIKYELKNFQDHNYICSWLQIHLKNFLYSLFFWTRIYRFHILFIRSACVICYVVFFFSIFVFFFIICLFQCIRLRTQVQHGNLRDRIFSAHIVGITDETM